MSDKPEKIYDTKIDLGEQATKPTRSKTYVTEDGRKFYPTASGVLVEILGISPLLMQRVGDAFRKKNPEPMPPTYEVETGGGGKEVHYHDEESVETIEEVTAFNAFKEEHKAWRAASQKALLRAVVIKGVTFDMPDDDKWVSDQELLGLADDIPDDPLERKVYYFETEVVGSVEDMLTLLGGAMGMGGMDQDEVVGTAMNMFRAEVQGQANNN